MSTVLLERDYDELPPTKDGRKPILRPSEAINLAGQDTGRHTLSHTRLAVWLACHRKFELDYLQRLELVRAPRYFTLGKAFQKAIEHQDPEVGVRLLNGFEPCEACRGKGVLPPRESGLNAVYNPSFDMPICETCHGRGYVGEQRFFHYEDAEREHRINEAIVRGASALYLRKWPEGPGETREVEYRVQLRSPWTGAYSRTYDLLGYADGVIDGGGLVCPNGCPNPSPAWWPAPVGEVDPPCSNCDAPLAKRDDSPLEVIENKLVGRIEKADVLSLPLNRQLALERYGLWRATGRPVTRVWYRWIKKPSIRQREGRRADKSDAETLDQFCQRVEADYEARPDFYVHEEDPSFVTTADLLRIEADLWEWATDIRARMHRGSDGRRRVFDRNTSHCSNYGGCQFLPICKGDPDAMSLYQVRPKRTNIETAPEAD